MKIQNAELLQGERNETKANVPRERCVSRTICQRSERLNRVGEFSWYVNVNEESYLADRSNWLASTLVTYDTLY